MLPAPSAPSGPHIPEAGLGSTLDRGVGAGGGAVRSLEPGRGASRSRRHVRPKGRDQGHKVHGPAIRPAGGAASPRSSALGHRGRGEGRLQLFSFDSLNFVCNWGRIRQLQHGRIHG